MQNILAQIKLLVFALFDPTDITYIYPTEEMWLDAAKKTAVYLGDPIATLNTTGVKRFLFKNGRSIDLPLQPFPSGAPYLPKRLVQHALGLFSSQSSMSAALACAKEYHLGMPWIVDQPDPDFAKGDLVIMLTNDDQYNTGSIFRKAALKMDGPRPQPFVDWPK